MRLPVGNQLDQWFNKDGTPTAFGFERLKQLLEVAPDIQPITANLTMNKAGYNGVLITINAAAGLTVILPASDGGNAKYKFLIGTTVTSNNVIIKVANTTDSFIGQSMMVSDDPATVKGFIAAAGDDTITLNGGTKGGFAGDQIEIIDILRGTFAVRITGKQTGAEATMFSATV